MSDTWSENKLPLDGTGQTCAEGEIMIIDEIDLSKYLIGVVVKDKEKSDIIDKIPDKYKSLIMNNDEFMEYITNTLKIELLKASELNALIYKLKKLQQKIKSGNPPLQMQLAQWIGIHNYMTTSEFEKASEEQIVGVAKQILEKQKSNPSCAVM